MVTIKSPPKAFKFSTMAGADTGVVQSNSLNWEKKHPNPCGFLGKNMSERNKIPV